jgi:hypothetical protein
LGVHLAQRNDFQTINPSLKFDITILSDFVYVGEELRVGGFKPDFVNFLSARLTRQLKDGGVPRLSRHEGDVIDDWNLGLNSTTS